MSLTDCWVVKSPYFILQQEMCRKQWRKERRSQKNLYPSQTCGPSILPEHLRCFPSLVGGSGGSNTESLGSRPKAGKEGSNLEAS